MEPPAIETAAAQRFPSDSPRPTYTSAAALSLVIIALIVVNFISEQSSVCTYPTTEPQFDRHPHGQSKCRRLQARTATVTSNCQGPIKGAKERDARYRC